MRYPVIYYHVVNMILVWDVNIHPLISSICRFNTKHITPITTTERLTRHALLTASIQWRRAVTSEDTTISCRSNMRLLVLSYQQQYGFIYCVVSSFFARKCVVVMRDENKTVFCTYKCCIFFRFDCVFCVVMILFITVFGKFYRLSQGVSFKKWVSHFLIEEFCILKLYCK